MANEAFFKSMIDYAGFFPPAGLPLDQALDNYIRYLARKDAWLLGRFVCPAARLGELGPLAERLPRDGQPPVIAAIGRGGKDAQEYFTNLQTDLAEIARSCKVLGDRMSVTSYEVRLPLAAFSPLQFDQVSSLIAMTANLCETVAPFPLTPFFESPRTERGLLQALIQSLQDDHHSSAARTRRRCQPPGFKLRAGGLEPVAIPASAELALALGACAAARVPFKATAGLHHPLRHFDTHLNAAVHGFVNVFAAGCLAFAHHLDEAGVLAIVDEEDPAHFQIGPDHVSWRGVTATTEAIAEARQVFTSFGSCSFDEPRDGLHALGWLAASNP